MSKVLSFNKTCQQEKEQNQGSLFDLVPSLVKEKLVLKEVEPATAFKKLAWERELLGLYVTAHPTERFVSEGGDTLLPLADAMKKKDKAFVKVCVSIDAIKKIFTKKQEEMAFVTISDTTGMGELIVFPRSFAKYRECLVEGAVMLVSAKMSTRGGEEKLLCNSIIEVTEENQDELIGMVQDGMWIEEGEGTSFEKATEGRQKNDEIKRQPWDKPKVKTGVEISLHGKPSQDMIADLREVFQSSPGGSRVYFIIESAGEKRQIETEYVISTGPDVVEALQNIVGSENVKMG